MTTTTERIAAAIKGILEEDRRADRERIAELERDAAHFASVERTLECWQELIDDLNRQLDEAHKENARLVLENAHLKEQMSGALCAIERDSSHAGHHEPTSGPLPWIGRK